MKISFKAIVKKIIGQAVKKKNIFIYLCLLLIVGIFLVLSIYFPWNDVFKEPIRYAADDGVYHMRIVENLLLGDHYPQRIYFDPYTFFPYGTYIHFAPLYDHFLAGIIWIASLGQPTLEIINKIAPFYPPALGALTVILLFFIGKALWGIFGGLLSAFLLAISGSFLFRSLLGAVDHHQAEALFSSMAVLFLILAFQHYPKHKFSLYTILAGIGLGLYFLFFNGALLFLFIFFVSIVLYYLIEFLSGRTPNWILACGGAIFLIVLLMITPWLGRYPDLKNAPLYNINHLASIILGILGFLVFYLLGKFVRKRNLKSWMFFFFMIICAVFCLLFLIFLIPSVWQGIVESFKFINTGYISQKGPMEWRDVARESIGEMGPLTIQGAYNRIGIPFYLSFIAVGILVYQFIKKRKPEYLLIIICFFVFVALTGSLFPVIGQNKLIYYLAIFVALLCGFLIIKGVRFAVSGWKISKNFKAGNYLKFGSFLLLFNIVFFVFYPFPLNLINRFPDNLPRVIGDALSTANTGAIGRQQDWYDALQWLKENTPDPGVDYYALYEGPGMSAESGLANPYPYPESVYGIMAGWDSGHMITYYAQRMPHANPFQQGLTRKGFPGEADFFLTQSEEEAVSIADFLKTRYVITDTGGCDAYGGFYSKALWLGVLDLFYFQENEEGPTGEAKPVYDSSTCARLHFLDGTIFEYDDFYVPALTRFRLVYESENTSRNFAFEGREIAEIKEIKLFEYVPGATLIGPAKDGQEVVISTNIITNQERAFTYKQSTIAQDGLFQFIVPYSTDGEFVENGTKYEVFAEPYIIKIDGYEWELNVREDSIMTGEIIEVELEERDN